VFFSNKFIVKFLEILFVRQLPRAGISEGSTGHHQDQFLKFQLFGDKFSIFFNSPKMIIIDKNIFIRLKDIFSFLKTFSKTIELMVKEFFNSKILLFKCYCLRNSLIEKFSKMLQKKIEV
jgi:hypothetical protein